MVLKLDIASIIYPYRLFILLLCYCNNMISIAEYCYPIAILEDNKKILYIHQNSPSSIQLFSWNSSNNTIEQVLWSLFNPTCIKLLPGKKGFSFMDNGRLRIYCFNKRSPKTIDFDEPIFNINSIEWVNEHTGYCSAQFKNHNALFEFYDNGTIECIAYHDEKDYLYPQKVKQQLLFIGRELAPDNSLQYSIMQVSYPKTSKQKNNSLVTLLNFGIKPIIFLTMVNENEGFVIEHPPKIESNAQSIEFIYHHLIKENTHQWSSQRLFSFYIPTQLIIPHHEECLFESILPLIPRIINKTIYFSDCSDSSNNFLELYSYNIHKKTITKIKKNNGTHFFMPILINNTLWCGGGGDITINQIKSKKSPFFIIC